MRPCVSGALLTSARAFSYYEVLEIEPQAPLNIGENQCDPHTPHWVLENRYIQWGYLYQLTLLESSLEPPPRLTMVALFPAEEWSIWFAPVNFRGNMPITFRSFTEMSHPPTRPDRHHRLVGAAPMRPR